MTDATRQPVTLDDESYYQDPAGFFARLRESGPVVRAWTPGLARAWIVTRYAHARAALADPRLAKDVHRWPGGPRSRPSEPVGLHAHMLNTDPPDHTRLRMLVQQAFTPGRAALLRPRAEQIADALLERMAQAQSEADGGVADLLPAYARPLPVTVICELLGVPDADRERIAVAVVDYSRPEHADRVTRELSAYFTDLIAAKRAEPGDDLVSALIRVRDGSSTGGGALTETELLSTIYQLVMAGFDTTVNLIASGVLALLTHPGQAARLREDPSLLPGAVEELLRFTNPVNHATSRFTTQEVTIGGVAIAPGEWVLVALTSADRDPDRFPDPDRLDLRRDAAGHVAFGHGIHYCLGAALARMEAEVALGALLARFPHLSLAAAPDELRWRRTSLMNGLESLPVRLA